MIQPLEEQSSPQRWLFLMLIAGLVLITAIFLLSRILLYSGPELMNSPYSAETTSRLIELGSSTLKVPENMIRHADQRSNGPKQKLELVFLWPEMKGFNLEDQVAFNNVTDTSRLIFVTLSTPREPMATSDRLHDIYSPHFRGSPIQGANGLIGFEMSRKSGYAGETIFFKPEDSKPFVTRCMKPVEQSASFCIRDLVWQEQIQVSYRFRHHLLTQWSQLDIALEAKMRELQLSQ